MLHKGASIFLLLEIYDDLVVILFDNSSQNIYLDTRGHAAENKIIFDTAIREGRESKYILLNKISILNLQGCKIDSLIRSDSHDNKYFKSYFD